jgi:flavin-binding protein dodecin
MAKYKSRAIRLQECLKDVQEKIDLLNSILDNQHLTQENAVKEAQGTIEDLDLSEIEELAGEMRNWADGMSGTNLEATEKFERVEEAASTLENIDISIPDISEFGDISEAIDFLENVVMDAEGVDFPGMYG